MFAANRRRFLQTTTAACRRRGHVAARLSGEAAAGLGRGGQARSQRSSSFTGDIEPLVRLLEETPREKLLEEVAGRIHKGTSYREVLAALLLAGVRNVQPRPSVGFKFHAVLVVNSAHLASISSPDEHRWLPIFWALDSLQVVAGPRRARKGTGRWRPVDESRVPPPHQARQGFHRRDGPLGRSRRRRRRRRPGPHRRRERAVRHVRPLRLPRLPLDRPQGDLRRQLPGGR